jgi:hypothetical protein
LPFLALRPPLLDARSLNRPRNAETTQPPAPATDGGVEGPRPTARSTTFANFGLPVTKTVAKTAEVKAAAAAKAKATRAAHKAAAATTAPAPVPTAPVVVTPPKG